MKKRKKNQKNMLLVLIGVLAAVLIAAVILLVVLMAKEKDPQDNPGTSGPTGESQSATVPEQTGDLSGTTGVETAPTDGSTAPTDSVTQPTVGTTGPVEGTAKPTEPVSKPTDPTVKPTDPTVKPTDPTVKPTDPTVKPTDPTVKPTDPTVKPTDPATEPSEDDPEPTQGTIPDVPTEPTAAPTAPEAGDEVIQTPYCTLYYPGEYKDYLEVQKLQGQPYKVTFIARVSDSKAARLFAIVFGGTPEYPVGSVKLDDGTTVNVSVENYEIETGAAWTLEETQTAYAMQEALNYVLQNMPLEEAGSDEPAPGGDITVTTPYCTLYYPAKWDGYVTAEQKEDGPSYIVAFYGTVQGHAKQLLFTVYFNSDEGTQIATVNNTLVSLTVNELVLDGSWSQSDSDTIFAMQEDMNYLLGKLNG